MGDDPNDMVTDSAEQFYQVRNTFCVDQAIFPRGGSANPVPSGLTLARWGAETIANRKLEVAEERDWQGRARLHAAVRL
jgi:choline dehydrogenase-like flavoprotein